MNFHLAERSKNWLVVGMIILCAVITLTLPGFITRDMPLSPISGLMVQKSLAQESMAYDEAMANSKPTLIEFYADWCTTCQSFAPTLQAVHERLGDNVNFVMLDIDDPQWREPIQQFQATGVPHLTLLDSDHSLVETWIGQVPKAILLDKAEPLLS